MRNLTISFFNNAKSRATSSQEVTWGKLASVLTHHEISEQKDGGAVGFYALKPGTTRAAENVEAVHLVALDFDSCTSYDEIKCAVEGYEHVFHTSYSHSITCPKGRLVLPLSRPAMPDEWPAVWRGANALTHELADPAAKDIARLFFLPRHPTSSAGEALSIHHSGLWVDTDDLIGLGQSRGEVPAATAARTNDPFGLAPAYDETRVNQALEKLDWDDRDQWLKAGMALHSTDRGEAAYSVWTGYSERSTKFDVQNQRATWDSFKTDRDRTVTLGTLFHLAEFVLPSTALPTPESTHARNELGLADRFVKRHTDDVRYVTDESIYLVWDGQIWQRESEHAVKRLMVEIARSVLRDEAPSLMGKDDREAKATATWAIDRAQKNNTIVNALELVKLDSRIAIKSRALDAEVHLLQVENGIIDLRSGAFTESFRQALHTRCSNATYVSGASAHTWQRFLNDITGSDTEMQAYLARAVGYSLSGITSALVFFFAYGLGANGKSVFLNVIRELAGSYGTTAKAESFMVNRVSGSGATPTYTRSQIAVPFV
jgi:putative DNA primase/helicase